MNRPEDAEKQPSRASVVAQRGLLLGGRARKQVSRASAGPVAWWRQYVAPIFDTLSGIGRAVVVVGIVCWILAIRFGWVEMAVIAATCVVLLAVAALFMIGTTHLGVTTVVEPPRVAVGDPLTGELTARNLARTPLVSTSLEFPIGAGGATVELPVLLPGAEHSELFVIPTERRGVIPVGPVTSVRGDPLGVFRRELRWTEQTQVFVHPRVTPLEPLGAGLIRDLEGNSSQSITMSDLAFHALREYVPGDDLRHVHWRSSARQGTLLVRQFLDTRRSHLTVVVDSNPSAYLSEDDYETAISVGASLLVRALRDGFDVSFVSGRTLMNKATGRSALDACSRAVPEASSMVETGARAAQIAPDTSLAILVTGSQPPYAVLQRTAGHFGVETGRAAIRVDATKEPGLRTRGDLPVLTLADLSQLGLILRWGL